MFEIISADDVVKVDLSRNIVLALVRLIEADSLCYSQLSYEDTKLVREFRDAIEQAQEEGII